MVLRWVAAGVLEAAQGFRRVNGCNDMPALVAALRVRGRAAGIRGVVRDGCVVVNRAAAEFQQRKGHPLACQEGSDQRGHILTSLHPTEPLRRFEHPGGDPAQHHRPAAPAFHMALHVARAAEETLNGVRGGERSLEDAPIDPGPAQSACRRALSRTLVAALG